MAVIEKVKFEMQCPECGAMAECKSWRKDYTIFEELKCKRCGVLWGRIASGGSGTWHVLERL